MPPPTEVLVSVFDPLPHRYTFVPNRNIMPECRARAHAIGRPVYVVRDSRGETVGLRVPRYVLESILWEEAVNAENESEGGEDVDVDEDGDVSSRGDTDVESFLSPDEEEDGEEDEEEYEAGWGFPNSEMVSGLLSDSESDCDVISSSDESFDSEQGGCELSMGDDDDPFSDSNCTCGCVHGSSFWDEM